MLCCASAQQPLPNCTAFFATDSCSHLIDLDNPINFSYLFLSPPPTPPHTHLSFLCLPEIAVISLFLFELALACSSGSSCLYSFSTLQSTDLAASSISSCRHSSSKFGPLQNPLLPRTFSPNPNADPIACSTYSYIPT